MTLRLVEKFVTFFHMLRPTQDYSQNTFPMFRLLRISIIPPSSLALDLRPNPARLILLAIIPFDPESVSIWFHLGTIYVMCPGITWSGLGYYKYKCKYKYKSTNSTRDTYYVGR